MFFHSSSRLSIPAQRRVVLVAGGSGTLGQALLSQKPSGTLLANVSKSRFLAGHDVVTCQFDLVKEPERAFRHLAALLPFVDVFVYAAYSPTFSPFARIERKRFLAEYETNVYTAMLCTRLCAEHFWNSNEENRNRSRKVILISSAAAFGKTHRPELASYSATKAALNALGPYVHDYLFETYGIPVSILAPGSLRNPETEAKFVSKFWEVSSAPLERFMIETIV